MMQHHTNLDDANLDDANLDDANLEDASPLALLRRLGSDEEASAAVEFIILIPVYLLLLAGLYMFVNLALVRQALVQANRFQVWSAQDPNSYSGFQTGDAFFGPYTGTFTPEARDESDVTLSSGSVTESDLQFQGDEASRAGGAPPSARPRYLAADALNNLSDRPHVKIEAEASFTYEGLRVFGLPTIKQVTQCSVILVNDAERPEFKEGDQNDPHPVLNWTVDGSRKGKQAYFDPTQPANMPLNPIYDGGYGEFSEDPGAANSGIWNRDARIGGDDQAEWYYYKDKPKG